MNFLTLSLLALDAGLLAGGVVLIVLLLCSALISGSEVAYFSLSPKDKSYLDAEDSVASRSILKLLENSERLLATILIANNFVNIGIVILSTYLSSNLFDFGDAYALKVLIDVVVITFLILLFGEIIPKIYANLHAPRFARFMALSLTILERLFRPLASILIHSTSIVTKRVKKKQNLSLDELSQAIEITADDINEEKDMLEGIVKFSNTGVSEVMKSRVDVIAVDLNTSFSKLKSVIIDSGFSRIPIFSKTFDDIKGILYIKDLLPHLHKSNTFKWQTLIRPPFYIPESKKINDLLKDFQSKKMHLAIVIDEYGGSSGIITMEDILEEIVGEISDESDEQEVWHELTKTGEYIFEGKTPLYHFCEVLDIEMDSFLEEGMEAETIAGLILELKEEFPEKKEEIVFKDFIFKITSIDKRRIKKILVKHTKGSN